MHPGGRLGRRAARGGLGVDRQRAWRGRGGPQHRRRRDLRLRRGAGSRPADLGARRRPVQPGTILAGSRPAGVYRSTDGGATWSALATGVAETASIGHTRVTGIRHTEVPGEIWVSVEIGGLLHSTDGGDSWEKVHTEGGRVLLGPDEAWTDERHFDMHDVAVG